MCRTAHPATPTVHLDATGTIQLGERTGDIASPEGAPAGWVAPRAPVRDRASGGLVARIGDSAPVFVGARNSIQASTNGRLYLTNNDDYLGDNAGEFRVTIDVSSR